MIASSIGRLDKCLRYKLGNGPGMTHAVLIRERDLYVSGLLLTGSHLTTVALIVDMTPITD